MERTTHHQVLDVFVATAQASVGPATAARYARVHRQLLRFLDEAELGSSLGTGLAALLGLERELGGPGAFLRVYGFDELVCCLPAFVGPSWLLPARADARSQISLSGRLPRWLDRHGYLDSRLAGWALWEAEKAMDDARHRLREGFSDAQRERRCE